MKRIYKPYTEWEDFNNGMYDTSKKANEIYLIEKSIELLSNPNMFNEVAVKMLENWIISKDVNLSNKNQNRQSWIGQATCCYNHKCTEILTRIAWGKLTDKQRVEANKVADKLIKTYETENKGLYKRLGKQMLLQWNT